jgi:hypothetical protein
MMRDRGSRIQNISIRLRSALFVEERFVAPSEVDLEIEIEDWPVSSHGIWKAQAAHGRSVKLDVLKFARTPTRSRPSCVLFPGRQISAELTAAVRK